MSQGLVDGTRRILEQIEEFRELEGGELFGVEEGETVFAREGREEPSGLRPKGFQVGMGGV